MPHVLPFRSALLLAAALGVLGGCSKLDAQECAKLREQAFDLVNKPNNCENDADCKPSDWPGCAKPVNAPTVGKMKAFHDSFTTGKCEEKPLTCTASPPTFCSEGVCAFKYPKPPRDEGMKIE